MSNRIFYAVQNVSLAGLGSGWQSVGINGTVDFEQIFELGRLDIYQNLEGVPNVEITLERVILKDGNTVWGALGGTVTAVGNVRPNLFMSVADDNVTPYSASNFLQATGLYVSSYSVNFQIDGAMTESVTLVGNNLEWGAGGGASIQATSTGDAVVEDAADTNAVIRRQDITAASPGGKSRLQSASFSLDFSREDLFELGKKSPYYKAAGFPVEVTAEMEYLATDDVTGLEFVDTNEDDITTDETVSVTAAGLTFNMGDSARLTSSNYSGGDAGGGNATITYSYVGYNFFQIT
jgi:hypothetical protein